MRVSVIGAGNFGTAIAWSVAKNDHKVIIYDIIQSRVDDINLNHNNSEVFPNFRLQNNISAKSGFDELLNESNLVIFAVSSSALPLVLNQIKGFLTAETVILNLTKGLVEETGETLEKLYLDKLGTSILFGVGSGPNFAEEIIKNDPTMMVLATKRRKVFEVAHRALTSEEFKLELSEDIVGVEICAAMKNIMALAIGIHAGLGLGKNSKFTLLTRAVQEIMKLVLTAGGTAGTVLSPAGVGDLLMTATSENSRNFRFGSLVGQGLNKEAALGQIGSTVESLDTLEPALLLSQKYDLAMPILQAVSDLILGGASAREKILSLV